MRGKLVAHADGFANSGITPAGAGKTYIDGWHKKNEKDHPRRCGENGLTYPITLGSLGSPPQVRGKRVERYNGKFTDRITPAGAGKTGYAEKHGLQATDHPRRCGENG